MGCLFFAHNNKQFVGCTYLATYSYIYLATTVIANSISTISLAVVVDSTQMAAGAKWILLVEVVLEILLVGGQGEHATCGALT